MIVTSFTCYILKPTSDKQIYLTFCLRCMLIVLVILLFVGSPFIGSTDKNTDLGVIGFPTKGIGLQNFPYFIHSLLHILHNQDQKVYQCLCIAAKNIFEKSLDNVFIKQKHMFNHNNVNQYL